MEKIDIFIKARQYLLWFLTEEETMEKFGLTEATADGSNGTIVCSTMKKPPEFKELTLTSHIFSECFKTWSSRNATYDKHIKVPA